MNIQEHASIERRAVFIANPQQAERMQALMERLKHLHSFPDSSSLEDITSRTQAA